MSKDNSFEKINYSLRPAKSIERKIISQFCIRLSTFDFLNNYHYIGFGSIYYSDFILFHKSLHINKMSSIEFERNESRAKFNLPYNCINLYSGTSNEQLPTLINNDEKNITWLDYDSPLSNNMLCDINTYANKTSSGSMFIISVNANASDFQGSNKEEFELRKKILEDKIDKNKIPTVSKNVELSQKHLYKLYRQIIINEIEQTLSLRNRTLADEDIIKYSQIMNFTYADGAKMLTLGFIFYKSSDTGKVQSSKFEDLKFFKSDEEAYDIKAPKLTADEIRVLNKNLPYTNPEDYEISEIKNTTFTKESKTYAQVYQYFPQFSESLY